MGHPLRIYFGLIGLFGVVALIAGGLWLETRDGDDAVGTVGQQVERTIAALSRAEPEIRFDLLSLYLSGGRLELVDPARSLPRFHRLSTAPVRSLHAYATSCKEEAWQLGGDPHSTAEDRELAKAWIWARHVCEARAPLPTVFFQTPPFMHPGGRSFVCVMKPNACRASSRRAPGISASTARDAASSRVGFRP